MSTAVSETPTAQATGRYLYAIVDLSNDQTATQLQGLDSGPVYLIADGDVAAVVSDLPNQRIRPERRRVAAHHQVLKSLMDEHTVLPMAFGLIADGPEAVKRILMLNREAFLDQLQRVRGKVEMGLRVAWDVANIFEHVVAAHPELRTLRDHVFRDGREASQEEKIELGRMFDQLINEDRAEHQGRVMRLLQPCCTEVTANTPRNEREVMNLACLIDRDGQKDFEQRVIQAARLFDNRFAFDFNGPWPPHNFVEIDLLF